MSVNMEQPKKRGLFAMIMVAMAVLAVVCVVTLKSTGMNDAVLFGRRLAGEEATKAENKMAFKAMKLNTKYELKSEQKTILRGGSLTERANAAKSMKTNIYAGIKDMKKVVLEGLPGKNKITYTPVVSKVEETKAEDQRREMPSVGIVKGAYKAMKGQIKTTMRTMKGYIMATSAAGATFWAKHDAIRELKHEFKGAIMNERGIVETDDHDDDAWSHAGQQSAEVLAEVETKYETAAAKDTKTAVKEITANMKAAPVATSMMASSGKSSSKSSSSSNSKSSSKSSKSKKSSKKSKK